MAEHIDGIAAEYDLLPKLIQNLDRHLIFPLLQFSDEQSDEQTEEMKRMRFELLKPTNMTDYIGQLKAELDGLSEPPPEYAKKRDEVLEKRKWFEENTKKIADLLDDESVVSNLRSDKNANLVYLKENHGVTVEMVNQLYDYGQFQYSCGVYNEAAELLYRFRVLVCFHYSYYWQ
jgi:translation initiation factor 3 subunit E